MSTDTREALAALPKLPEPEAYFHVNDDGQWTEGGNLGMPMWTADQMQAYARAALATQPAAQPILSMKRSERESLSPESMEVLKSAVLGGPGAPMPPHRKLTPTEAMAGDAAQPSAQGEAWKLVPVELTHEMAKAMMQWTVFPDRCYRAMLASAPAAPAQAVPLTGEQIEQCVNEAELGDGPFWPTGTTRFVRAIERAHGIAPKAAQEKP